MKTMPTNVTHAHYDALTSRSFAKFALLAAVWSSLRRIPGGESDKLPSSLELPNTLANFLKRGKEVSVNHRPQT